MLRPEPLVTCLACTHIYPRALEMCPQRYLSPHDTDFLLAVVDGIEKGLDHKEAVIQARTNLKEGLAPPLSS